MLNYLVEVYVTAEPSLFERAHRHARRAAEFGEDVRDVRSTFAPDEEACIDLFEAAIPDGLGEAARETPLGYLRIVEAVETAVPAREESPR